MSPETDKKYTKEITTNFVKIGVRGEGDDDAQAFVTEIAGILLEKDRMNMSGGPVGRYKIEQANDEIVTFLGGVILDDKLSMIEIGSDILIKYTGAEKSSAAGHSPTKQYAVFVAE
ncbi:hypothetical protein LCGC14_2411980 [marine sediment metagenome]|uniref:Uncharacterized protein n=1 Tax=marine sediment metagenome TaxID=412755 RepID=A0A0F9CEE7_9ZZZZ